ncbi:thioredoxin-like protein [Talaromyces proteolyticus]|uniref:Thioredoxin-like protein n=1 Tax=Talaromyces proteolyticus TaxID=1131652 RepID=A0AAD4L0A8_9EURO|nr:thioredoxin-like protein [Talaromyces proteolyticus]KAH8701160.1 thioredoxin-like protein [Talaromyces proteolyticus]
MSLPPKFKGQKLATADTKNTPHTLELYLDYVCPFSAKMFHTFYKDVKLIIAEKYPSQLQVIFKQQIQPWHPSSTLVHEAGAAVLKVAPEKFWEFSEALFQKQTDFFDLNVVNETRNDTYKRLAEIAASVGVDSKQVFDLLVIAPREGGHLNGGNGVTDDIKLMIKANRVIGVHVSPTVFFDGIEERSISSSFSVSQWDDWLRNNVV